MNFAPTAQIALGLLVLLAGSSSEASPPEQAIPAADTLADISLEQLMDIPVETVSGVSKYEQSIRRAPAGVTIYTANEIRNHGWRTLADVLRNAPGIHIRNDRFYDYIGNRGFTRPFDYNSRTLLLIDGHRINDPIYQQGSVGTDFILDLDIVDRVEIIQGPGSSVYGSSAFYGAINVIPKTGRDVAGGQAALTLGSEPSGKARVSFGDRSMRGVEYLVSATQGWSRGEDDFRLPQSWRDEDPAFTALRARNRDDTRQSNLYARAAWRGLTAETAYVQRKKEVLPPVYFTDIDTPAYGIDERAYALVRASGEPSPDAAVDFKLSLDYYSYAGLFSPAFTDFETQRPYADSLSINSELRWRQTLADRHTLALGVEFQENLRQNLGRDNLATGEAVTRVRESSRYASPFAQLDWEFTPRVRATAGGRFDYYSTGEERLTPRVGFIWDASAATTLKLLYGESFRVPNIEERYVAEVGIVPNPDIGPELNRSWELIALHRLNPVWSFDARLHHSRSSDLITTVLTEANPVEPDEVTFVNAQSYITTGLDLGTAATFATGLTLRASGTVQRTTDDATGRIVTDAPRTLLKLQASAPVYESWLRASGELLYVGDRKDSFDAHVGDYLTANFTLRAVQVWQRWDLAFSVYNLADTRWSDPKNEGQITAAPRSFVLRATLDF